MIHPIIFTYLVTRGLVSKHLLENHASSYRDSVFSINYFHVQQVDLGDAKSVMVAVGMKTEMESLSLLAWFVSFTYGVCWSFI